MPAPALTAGPVVSDGDVSIVPILAELATLVAYAIVAAFAIVAKIATVAAQLTFVAKLATVAARVIVAKLAVVVKLGIVAVYAIVVEHTFVAEHLIQVAAAFVATLAILAVVLIVVAHVIAIGGWFFRTSDDNLRSYPRPSSRHHETTWLLYRSPTPPSYVRNSYAHSQSQTTGQTPATTDYGRSSYCRVLPYAGQSRQTLPASARTQASHQPPPVPTALSNLVFNELEDVEDVNTAMDIRERARRQHREMCDARARAKSARKRGDYAAERRHKQEAIDRRNAMDQLNMRAAEIIFKQKNKRLNEGTVDFHGLHVYEAVRYAKQELESASRRDDEVVRFIVGKGLHAEDGEPKIRPALVELCKKRGLTYSLDPRNAGVLIVQVD
ncbi:hypothetical protein BJV78DRAFT_1168995 [Lactifluus subvellereus]|nr:hypothetical protein BJV78DRAFT_1168995 [Lactifluus subvellereus]